MSLKLYFAPGACSFVPHAMLELAGAPFEPVAVKLHKGEQRAPEYLALNPRGQVPVLVDDGEVITQIVSILLHLDAKFPQAGILPASGLARTRALSTLAWMNNTVHPTFTHVFMPQKFTGDEGAQALLAEGGAHDAGIPCNGSMAIKIRLAAVLVRPASPGVPLPAVRCAGLAKHIRTVTAFTDARAKKCPGQLGCPGPGCRACVAVTR